MRVLRTNLSAGMILDRAAMDRAGRMLISSSTALTERLLEVLETAQIPILYVTDDSFEQHNFAPKLPPLSREQEREVNSRFRHVNLEEPFSKAVYDECMSHTRECNAQGSEASE